LVANQREDAAARAGTCGIKRNTRKEESKKKRVEGRMCDGKAN
jgi:hypothetical protein